MIPRPFKCIVFVLALLSLPLASVRAQDIVYAVTTHPWMPFWDWKSGGVVTQSAIDQWSQVLDHVETLGCTAVRLDMRIDSTGTAPDPQIITMVNMVKDRGLKLIPILRQGSVFDYASNRIYARVISRWLKDNNIPVVLYQLGNEEDRACHIGLDQGNPVGDGSHPEDYDANQVSADEHSDQRLSPGSIRRHLRWDDKTRSMYRG